MILANSVEGHGTLTTKGSTDDHQPLIILKSYEKHNPIFILLLSPQKNLNYAHRCDNTKSKILVFLNKFFYMLKISTFISLSIYSSLLILEYFQLYSLTCSLFGFCTDHLFSVCLFCDLLFALFVGYFKGFFPLW